MTRLYCNVLLHGRIFADRLSIVPVPLPGGSDSRDYPLVDLKMELAEMRRLGYYPPEIESWNMHQFPILPGLAIFRRQSRFAICKHFGTGSPRTQVTFLSWSLISNLLKKDSRLIDEIPSEFAPPIRFWTGCARSLSDPL